MIYMEAELANKALTTIMKFENMVNLEACVFVSKQRLLIL